MISLLKNRLAYLGISFVLLVAGFPLISAGTSRGPAACGGRACWRWVAAG